MLRLLTRRLTPVLSADFLLASVAEEAEWRLELTLLVFAQSQVEVPSALVRCHS